MALIYTGTAGSVDLPGQDLLQLHCSSGGSGGTVALNSETPVPLPPNTDWSFEPKQRWYGAHIVFTGTTFYFVEAA